MRNRLLVTALLAATGCMMGCGSATSEEAASSDEELSGGSLVGTFALAGSTNNDTWIEQLALHEDGAFEANMGNDVSNLSGHHYPASGTFSVAPHGSTLVLTLHAIGQFAGTSSYDVTVKGSALTVREHGVATSFAMQAVTIPTITFNADWTVTQTRPIVANGDYLIRYAASRNHCAAPAGGGVTLSALGQFEDGVTVGLVQGFNAQPVHGMLGSFGSVPPLGTELAVWFKGGSQTSSGAATGCTHWDSNLQKNYHFPVVAE